MEADDRATTVTRATGAWQLYVEALMEGSRHFARRVGGREEKAGGSMHEAEPPKVPAATGEARPGRGNGRARQPTRDMRLAALRSGNDNEPGHCGSSCLKAQQAAKPHSARPDAMKSAAPANSLARMG